MNSSELTYAGLLQWDSLKVASIVVNGVIMFVGPSLLYAVIWYERFSADLMYRTLINHRESLGSYHPLNECSIQFGDRKNQNVANSP